MMRAIAVGDLGEVERQIKALGSGVRYLADQAGLTPLMWAVIQDNPEIVTSLLNSGVDVEDRDKAGRSALCWAVILKRRAIIQQLIDNHAGLHSEDNELWSVLEYAGTLLDAGHFA